MLAARKESLPSSSLCSERALSISEYSTTLNFLFLRQTTPTGSSG